MSSLAAGSDIDKQAKDLEKRIGLANLKDPKFLDRFISRFLAGYDASNSQMVSIASLIQPLSAGGNGSLSWACCLLHAARHPDAAALGLDRGGALRHQHAGFRQIHSTSYALVTR